MKVRFEWKYTDGTEMSEPISETYEDDSIVDQASAEKYAQDLVDHFNDTLRPHEKHRTITKIEFIAEESAWSKRGNTPHQWYKTNLVTVKGRYTSYDEMECEECGITGRRYGARRVTRDEKYKAKVYQFCDTAQKQLKKLAERRQKKNEGS